MQDAERAELRLRMNTHVSDLLERHWPIVQRALERMARARWETAPPGNPPPRRRWKIETTLRLLEPPQPIDLILALGSAYAAVHITLECPVRRSIEAWTITLRAYVGHDEVKVIGQTTRSSQSLTTASLKTLLSAAALDGPGHYPISSAPGHRRRTRSVTSPNSIASS